MFERLPLIHRKTPEIWYTYRPERVRVHREVPNFDLFLFLLNTLTIFCAIFAFIPALIIISTQCFNDFFPLSYLSPLLIIIFTMF